MKICKEDQILFYRLKKSLYEYIDKTHGISEINDQDLEKIQENMPMDEFTDVLYHAPNEYLMKIRETLINNPKLIKDFVKSKPKNLSSSDIAIISSWEDFIHGEFFIMKELKNFTVFMDQGDPGYLYGVKSLHDEIIDMLPYGTPCISRTILFPFNNQIVYDGIINSYNLQIGKGIKARLNETYKESKALYGIIEKLPVSNNEKNQVEINTDLLKAWLSTKSSRERHEDDIIDIIEENPYLEKIYHYEMGKIHSRSLKRQYKNTGIKKLWLGVLKGLVISTGVSKLEVEQRITTLLPKPECDFVYYFHVK